MGILDWMGPIGSAVQGFFNIGSTASANRTQKQMQQVQNTFNAEQADLNRQFQSREAEIARDWQEQQYNLYSSPSAMVRQYQNAGLNPALMYGSNLQGSTGSSPSPSGSAASGSTPSAFAADLTGLASAFLGLAKLKQDIAESKSREAANYGSADNSFAGATTLRSQASLNHAIKKLTSKQIDDIDSIIRLRSKQEITESRKQRLLVVQTALQLANTKQISLQNAISDAFEDKFGYKADIGTIHMLMNLAGNIVGSVVDKSTDIINKFLPLK